MSDGLFGDLPEQRRPRDSRGYAEKRRDAGMALVRRNAGMWFDMAMAMIVALPAGWEGIAEAAHSEDWRAARDERRAQQR